MIEQKQGLMKKNTKNDIIAASINLMYLKGYNGTSVKDITDAAGIPKGSFYNHFEDKEHYAVDALNYYYSEFRDTFALVLLNKDFEPLDRIERFFKQGISRLEKQDLRLGCFLGNMIQEMGNVSELISDAAAKIQGNIEFMIHENLVEASRKKALKNGLDLKVLAGFILSSWQGYLLLMKITRDRTILRNFYTVLTNFLLK